MLLLSVLALHAQCGHALLPVGSHIVDAQWTSGPMTEYITAKVVVYNQTSTKYFNLDSEWPAPDAEEQEVLIRMLPVKTVNGGREYNSTCTSSYTQTPDNAFSEWVDSDSYRLLNGQGISWLFRVKDGIAPTTSTTEADDAEVEKVSIDITFGGLDYDKLMADATAKANLESGIKGTVLDELGDGYTVNDIEVTFSKGSIVATVEIKPKAGSDATTLSSELKAKQTALQSASLEGVKSMPGIADVLEEGKGIEDITTSVSEPVVVQPSKYSRAVLGSGTLATFGVTMLGLIGVGRVPVRWGLALLVLGLASVVTSTTITLTQAQGYLTAIGQAGYYVNTPNVDVKLSVEADGSFEVIPSVWPQLGEDYVPHTMSLGKITGHFTCKNTDFVPEYLGNLGVLKLDGNNAEDTFSASTTQILGNMVTAIYPTDYYLPLQMTHERLESFCYTAEGISGARNLKVSQRPGPAPTCTLKTWVTIRQGCSKSGAIEKQYGEDVEGDSVDCGGSGIAGRSRAQVVSFASLLFAIMLQKVRTL